MNVARLLPLIALLLTSGCVGPGRLPHTFMPPIAEEYYACEKCDSLHGGIYGKGPLANYATKEAPSCWHDWKPVSKTEFQTKAAEDFPSDWAKALPFFKSTTP